jgi:hypothetical protein
MLPFVKLEFAIYTYGNIHYSITDNYGIDIEPQKAQITKMEETGFCVSLSYDH